MQRVINLLAQLPNGAQAVLIHNPSNMRYFSGYMGEGLLVLGPDCRAIVTDFRYTEQAHKEAPDFEVFEIGDGKGHNAVALEVLDRMGAQVVAVEEDTVTYAQYQAIAAALAGKRLVGLDGVPEKLRRIKDEKEIDALSRANGLTSEAFEYIVTYIRPGMTEKHISLELERYMLEHGAEAVAFSTIIASGENGSLPHAVPGGRQVQAGDLITMDFGAKVDGYCADMTRTVALGAIDAEKRGIYDTVFAAQAMALQAVKAGASCREIDTIARSFIDQAGYQGKFGHGLGHATGLDIHENPRFSPTAAEDERLAAGMSMTVEPGIYVPGLGGVRIEDSVLVTETGCRILTPATKELITIG